MTDVPLERGEGSILAPVSGSDAITAAAPLLPTESPRRSLDWQQSQVFDGIKKAAWHSWHQGPGQRPNRITYGENLTRSTGATKRLTSVSEDLIPTPLSVPNWKLKRQTQYACKPLWDYRAT